MRLTESISLAFGSLRANKLRSFLTILGNIIGVMSVIAVVSIINGMNKYVSEKIAAQGSNVLYIDKFGMITSDEEWQEAVKRKDILLEDEKALASFMKSAVAVTGQVYARKTTKSRNQSASRIEIKGMTEGYFETETYDLEDGRHLDESDVNHKRPFAVLGYGVAEKLFPGIDPLGKEIRVGRNYLKVIGTIEKKGSLLGMSQDNFVIIPITTFQKFFGERQSVTILVKTKSAELMKKAEDEARFLLRMRRKIPFTKPDDFAILTADTFMNLYKNFTSTAFIVMVGVASLSLIVGGIVIMNIMLVTVTERTREIGIRKAVGARARDVLQQFLVEAVALSTVGGIIGILLGIVIAKTVSSLTPLPSSVRLWSVLAGLLVSSSVGIFFGIYPARRAAQQDTIVALRYE
ncbi:MAG: ABC transporter permease [Candidatus Eisenbacteria bacterium]|nr:ABC transporter permease [Candidatus Eisenbacteria bacterium]